ncbi:hypothetical protein ACLKA7_016946 [Drosophila subpalustris]
MSTGSSQIDPQEVDERNASTNTVPEIITMSPPVVSSNDRSTGTRRRGRRVTRGRRYVAINRELLNYSDQESVNNHYRPYVIRRRGQRGIHGPEENRNVPQQFQGNRLTLQLRILEVDIRNVNNVINIDIGAPEGSSTTFVATLTATNNNNNGTNNNNNETNNNNSNETSNENNASNANNTNNESSTANGDNAQDVAIDRGQNNAQDAATDRGRNDNGQDASEDRSQNTSP